MFYNGAISNWYATDSSEPMDVAMLTVLDGEQLKDPLIPGGMRYRFL